MEKKYIETAREVLSSYDSGQGVDLQHLLAVLIGPKATPELCGRLSAKGLQDLTDLTEHELCGEGLTLTQAQQIMAGFQVGRKWSFVSNEQRFTIRSPEDIDITKRLAECGKLIGIELLDHVVVCTEKYVSMKEKGCL